MHGRHVWVSLFPGKNIAQLKCRTVKYLHSFEMNQLRKSLFLHPKDVQVSTIVPGAVMTMCKLLSVPGKNGALQTPRSLWT